MNPTAKPHRIFQLVILLIGLAACMVTVLGVPVGPVINFVANSSPSSTPASQANASGYIYFGTISATQQDSAWKGYVGNVSGAYTLDDANGYTLYRWDINETLIVGEVYATRNNSIDWTSIACANNTVVLNETHYFGMGIAEADNINNTFNFTTHRALTVGTNTISANSCRNTYTFVNDSAQAASTTAFYQEVLLADRNFHLIYTTGIESNAYNFQAVSDRNTTSDFQMILPENRSISTPTTFYFYVEIG